MREILRSEGGVIFEASWRDAPHASIFVHGNLAEVEPYKIPTLAGVATWVKISLPDAQEFASRGGAPESDLVMPPAWHASWVRG
jgi:hypothetical protein